MDDKKYEETVSESKEESILKAISILETECNRASDRVLIRPNISVLKTVLKHLLCLCTYVVACFIATIVLRWLEIGAPYTFLIPILLGIVLFALNVKRICVDFVLIYQKLAPEKLRLSCVFEPSCSEYMLLAIEKYGVCKGVFKGIKRLLRCHPPNGGVDYP